MEPVNEIEGREPGRMQKPAKPDDEQQRLAALRASGLLDSPSEERFDRLTRLAKQLFGVETVLISLLDADRAWSKSRQGMAVCETDRDITFCGHAILTDDIFEVVDTLEDERFFDNPLVVGPPFIRFYAAASITSTSGNKLGTFCLFDSAPRRLSVEERWALRDFANSVEDEIAVSAAKEIKRVRRAPVDRRSGLTARWRKTSLESESERVQTILDQIIDSMILVDPAGKIESLNRAAVDMFGFTRHELLGKDLKALMPDFPFRPLQEPGQTQQRVPGSAWISDIVGFRQETRACKKDRSAIDVEFVFSDFRRGRRSQFLCMIRDITARKQLEQQINTLAFYDALTRLPNRRLLRDRLEHARQAGKRLESYGALLFIDLDNFKQLNDSAGHYVGDMLLQEAARRIRQCVRDSDTISRWGGDEFVVILESLGPRKRAAAALTEKLAEKIGQQLHEPFRLGDKADIRHQCSSSIGVTLFFDEDWPVDQLLKQADMSMYRAKALGGNTIVFFDPAMDTAVKARAEMGSHLRQALRDHDLVLYYQVQVDTDNEPDGAEALLRWRHPAKGLMLPADFLHLAEECQLSLPLGQWVLQTACEQLAMWAARPELAHLTMAVNISPQQFHHPDFADTVGEILDATGARPDRLKLELSETMLLHVCDSSLAKMQALEARGVMFSLDHFGKGQSSLEYLKTLPIEQLKIDRSFIQEMRDEASDVMIARTIIALGDSMGIRVIAEGVESDANRAMLLSMGCGGFQGFLYGRPLPAAEFERALTVMDVSR
ncbi:MAG: diguanylate cyclase [unclassified Hahellaceae]|nr:diguanylate cyclase [Hahellaceae bacterium]|tara:strand:- start:31518 stop:33848 length:2331 start_codon:yes stop_codon:yes gene_type:complete